MSFPKPQHLALPTNKIQNCSFRDWVGVIIEEGNAIKEKDAPLSAHPIGIDLCYTAKIGCWIDIRIYNLNEASWTWNPLPVNPLLAALLLL